MTLQNSRDSEALERDERRIDRNLLVGIYFCIFSFALAVVIYLVC